jgi:hypothetical protein
VVTVNFGLVHDDELAITEHSELIVGKTLFEACDLAQSLATFFGVFVA